MSPSKPNHIQKLRQEWKTPPEFWQAVCRRFLINRENCVDVACSTRMVVNEEVALHVTNSLCKYSISEEEDGLTGDWSKFQCANFWCNPGFKSCDRWAVKMCDEIGMASVHTRGFLLGPLTCAAWLTQFCYQEAAMILLLYPRIQFIAPEGIKSSSNSKDNVLIVFDNVKRQEPCVIAPWYWKVTT